MEGLFLTDRGKVRSHNEDSGGIFKNPSGQLLAIIADGMGGHRAGDVASDMATTMIKEEWLTLDELMSPTQIENWLTETLKKVNKQIFDYANHKEECQGMGSTIVIAVCVDEHVTVANIGDSRCYLIQQDDIKQITEDHSLVNELVRSGEITKEDARYHPRKNIVLKALGTNEHVAADVRTIFWDQGDILLLCSDGLTDKVQDEELFTIITSNNNLDQVGQQLINMANDRGGEDNVSLVVVKHENDNKEGDVSC